MLNFLYPNEKKKALTFSYDDGQVHDRRLVEMLNRNGLKGTFHLNSGRLGTPDFLDAGDVPALYKGHEIACHGVEHLFLTQLSRTRLVNELLEDRRSLEALTGEIITGLSYAFGDYDDAAIKCAQQLDIAYARTIKSTKNFLPPSDFMQWHPTCHHKEILKDENLLQQFLQPSPWVKAPLLYIWGHSYEFEFENNWDEMETLCGKLGGHDDVWYTTNRDYCRYINAVQNLIYSAGGKKVYNPTCTPVWLTHDDRVILVNSGETEVLAQV